MDYEQMHTSASALHHPEGMLDLGPRHGDDTVNLFVDGMELAALGCLAHDIPDLAPFTERSLALGADIAFVGPD